MKRSLKQQLQRTGADQKEATELADLAAGLGAIKSRGLSDKTKQEILDIAGAPKRRMALGWGMAGLATAVLAVVFVSQTMAPPSKTAPDAVQSNTDSQPAQTPEPMPNLEQAPTTELQQLEQQKEEPKKVDDVEKRYQDRYNSWRRQRSNEDDQDRSYFWRRYDSRNRYQSNEDSQHTNDNTEEQDDSNRY